LGEALDKVPRLLPPQIAAMLKVGEKTGDIAKVLPACRKILTDSVSQITKAQNYLVILAFVVTPMGMLIVPMLAVFVFPKFNAIFQDLGATAPVFMRLLIYWTPWVVGLQAVLFVLFYLGAFIYVGGPRVIGWLEAGLPRLSEWLFHRIPWRRKRMLRDFSAMLAILLDAAVPEPEAVTMAADCTANGVFRARAETATDDLCRGVKLTEAMRHLDDTGQFRWRLANAVRGQQDGFRTALAGWHEALDAKAFQEEQAVAHAVTTALVLCNGLMVCLVAVAVFQPLIAIVKEGLLW
jgi:type II secretory pathway component PulF